MHPSEFVGGRLKSTERADESPGVYGDGPRMGKQTLNTKQRQRNCGDFGDTPWVSFYPVREPLTKHTKCIRDGEIVETSSHWTEMRNTVSGG